MVDFWKKPDYSEAERLTMQKWCDSNIGILRKLNFESGEALFRFGNYSVAAKNIKAWAQMENFISRLESDDYIVRDSISSKGRWPYRLTAKAFNDFESRD